MTDTATVEEQAELGEDLAAVASETPSAASPTPSEEAVPKWRLERDNHGQESIAQFIGNLTRDAEVVDPEGDKYPYVWGGIAVNRGEDQPSSFHTFYIYGVKDDPEADDSTRPTLEMLQELAKSLTKGHRVKLQGKHDLRPIKESLYNELVTALGLTKETARDNDLCREVFFAGRSSIRLFIRQNQMDLKATYNDGSERRPITLLPAIGEAKEDPKSIF